MYVNVYYMAFNEWNSSLAPMMCNNSLSFSTKDTLKAYKCFCSL